MNSTSKFEELTNGLGKDIRNISEHAQLQSKKLEKVSERVKKLTEHTDLEDEFFKESGQSIINIDEKVDSVQKSMKKNNATLNDLLQEWSKLRKQQKKLIEFVADSFLDSDQESQSLEDIRSLLGLVMTYHEQYAALCGMLRDDDGRKEDLDSMNRKLQDARRLSGIDVLGQKDEAVREEYHQVLDILGPSAPDSPLVVETVVENGYLYHGQVIRKARVIARASKEAAEDGLISPDQVDHVLSKKKKKKNRHEKKNPFSPELPATEEQADCLSSIDLLLDDKDTSVADTLQNLFQDDSADNSISDTTQGSSELLETVDETGVLSSSRDHLLDETEEAPVSKDQQVSSELLDAVAEAGALSSSRDHLIDEGEENHIYEDHQISPELLEAVGADGVLSSSRDHLLDKDTEAAVSDILVNLVTDNTAEKSILETEPLSSAQTESTGESEGLSSSEEQQEEVKETPASEKVPASDQDDKDGSSEEPAFKEQQSSQKKKGAAKKAEKPVSSLEHLLGEDDDTSVSDEISEMIEQEKQEEEDPDLADPSFPFGFPIF